LDNFIVVNLSQKVKMAIESFQMNIFHILVSLPKLNKQESF